MTNIYSKEFLGRLRRKPFSLTTTLLALGIIIYSLYHILIGNIYLSELNYVDGTTLIMVGILMLRAVKRLENDSDSQTVSIALISILSFLFTYEAIYKWSFYFFPWRMPPEELREFIIQVGIGLVVLAGFAYGKFEINITSKIFLTVFVAGWIFWLLIGFPQLWNGETFYSPIWNIPFTWGMIYYLNRLTKISLFFVYSFIYR